MKILKGKAKLKALQELLKNTDMSAWEGVEKYRSEHNGELPLEQVEDPEPKRRTEKTDI